MEPERIQDVGGIVEGGGDGDEAEDDDEGEHDQRVQEEGLVLVVADQPAQY